MYPIIAVRTELSDDETHNHIVLVGYESPHTPGEPIMVDIPRVLQRFSFGEKFYVVAGEERLEVQPGKCAACGHEPYLTTAGSSDDSVLLALPER